MRGAIPVFVDISSKSLNIDPERVKEAVTDRTKAIVVVHYAGVVCEMDELLDIADSNGLVVIEDAAQAYLSTYKGRYAGSIGTFGAMSFHETKNIISGEGGVLFVNDSKYIERAEIIREKGTDRSKFHRGEVDKYTWRDIGSSYLPGEIVAAFLWAQLEHSESIINKRVEIWNRYESLVRDMDYLKILETPTIPANQVSNGHLYHVLLPNQVDRSKLISELKEDGFQSVFHYVPLHSSPAGKKFCRTSGLLSVTDDIASRILRLPLWVGLGENVQKQIVASLIKSVYHMMSVK